VLVTGGGFPTNAAELHDPGTGTWSATGSLAEGRESHSQTTLADGRVLAAGGLTSVPTAATEPYQPALGPWAAGPTLQGPRWHHRANLLPDGRVLFVGGPGNTGEIYASEVFDPADDSVFEAGLIATGRHFTRARRSPTARCW
jgi:hypothetical protein